MLTEELIEDMLLELTDNGVKLEFEDSIRMYKDKSYLFVVWLEFKSNKETTLKKVETMVKRFEDSEGYIVKVKDSSSIYPPTNEITISFFNRCSTKTKSGNRCKRVCVGVNCSQHQPKTK